MTFFERTWRIFGGGFLYGMAAVSAFGHDPATTKLTWTREISRIIEKRCMGCHQAGGIAPMPLETFAQARPWAVAMKEEVLRRSMPPWPAAKGFGDFANDISLPQEEINRLAEWVEGGAPEGEPQYLKPKLAVPLWKPAKSPSGRLQQLSGRLGQDTRVLAVRGSGSGRIWGETPDGQTKPIVWLNGTGKRKIVQWLIFRDAVLLPAGTMMREGAVEALVQ